MAKSTKEGLSKKDKDQVSHLLGEYVNWRIGNEGTSWRVIQNIKLKPEISRELLKRIDGINFFLSLFPERDR